MSTTAVVILSLAAIVIIFITLFFSYNNKEIALRKEAEAQEKKIETIRDRMFQIVRELANVSSEYRDAFNEIYPNIISGRYSDGGSLMKWIQEQNPQFDSSLYKDVQNAIEVQRTAFTSTQNRMIDIINQRATLIESYPSRWFLQNKTAIDFKPVATSSTKQVMTTRVDDYTFSYT